jgi:signal transduction histidine kinase
VVENCWVTVETPAADLVLETSATIRADRSRLQQLLENLIRNAVEHGGEDVTVTVGDLDAGFYVADDGPGIALEDREQIFESGYTTTDGGTGFGLRIVREIADAHDWSVSVTSSDQGGARFEVTGVEVV